MGKFLSFTCRRYSRKAVANAKIYINPYQRNGNPGIISGLSHEGKFTDKSMMFIIDNSWGFFQTDPEYRFTVYAEKF